MASRAFAPTASCHTVRLCERGEQTLDATVLKGRTNIGDSVLNFAPHWDCGRLFWCDDRGLRVREGQRAVHSVPLRRLSRQSWGSESLSLSSFTLGCLAQPQHLALSFLSCLDSVGTDSVQWQKSRIVRRFRSRCARCSGGVQWGAASETACDNRHARGGKCA